MTNERQHFGVGIVVIGRNEGERLRMSLASAIQTALPVVYVDSGSTDNSIDIARLLGAHVVPLTSDRPFSAARARNAGVHALATLDSDLQFVQVLDGDCELQPEWIANAVHTMRSSDRIAVVCGRRRERDKSHSIYHQLCDMEWNTPIGDSLWCGGDALIRVNAFFDAGGYNDNIIAGEEPELCLRLRHAKYRIVRIDAEMTIHDARMYRFSQWWKRAVRAGHAYAEGRALHRKSSPDYFRREMRSIMFWGMLIPLMILVSAPFTQGWSLLLFIAHVSLWCRIARNQWHKGDRASDCAMFATFCVIGKFAETQGVIQFWINSLRGKRTRLIEYKVTDKSLAYSTGPQ